VAGAEAYMRAKFHLDTANRSDTIDIGLKLGGSAPFGEGSSVPI